jgi:hypothetical protein
MAVRWCVFKKNTGTTRRFQESYFVSLYPPIRIDPRFCFIARFYFDELLEKYPPRRTLQILIHRPSNVAGVILDPTIFLLVPGVDYRKMEAPFIWQTMNWECSLLIVNHPYPIMVLIIAVQCVGYLQYLLNAHHVSILLVKNLGSSHNIVSEEYG